MTEHTVDPARCLVHGLTRTLCVSGTLSWWECPQCTTTRIHDSATTDGVSPTPTLRVAVRVTPSSDTPIPPALTPEEWQHKRRGKNTVWVDGYGYPSLGIKGGGVCTTSDSGRVVSIEDRHATAALCLYGQPYGFSQDEVAALDGLVNMQDARPRVFVNDTDGEPLLQILLVKLRALLPSP